MLENITIAIVGMLIGIIIATLGFIAIMLFCIKDLEDSRRRTMREADTEHSDACICRETFEPTLRLIVPDCPIHGDASS